jgi:hypothetical protein
LMREYNVFQVCEKYMRGNYGIMQDFARARGKNGHLVIVRGADGVHVVMLDNGIFDEKRDQTPGLHLANNFLAENSFKKQLKKLGK